MHIIYHIITYYTSKLHLHHYHSSTGNIGSVTLRALAKRDSVAQIGQLDLPQLFNECLQYCC